MSTYPRTVLSGVTVRGVFVKSGTVVDIQPGSGLEAEYGAASLSAVIPASDPRRSPEAAPGLSREALAN